MSRRKNFKRLPPRVVAKIPEVERREWIRNNLGSIEKDINSGKMRIWLEHKYTTLGLAFAYFLLGKENLVTPIHLRQFEGWKKWRKPGIVVIPHRPWGKMARSSGRPSTAKRAKKRGTARGIPSMSCPLLGQEVKHYSYGENIMSKRIILVLEKDKTLKHSVRYRAQVEPVEPCGKTGIYLKNEYVHSIGDPNEVKITIEAA